MYLLFRCSKLEDKLKFINNVKFGVKITLKSFKVTNGKFILDISTCSVVNPAIVYSVLYDVHIKSIVRWRALSFLLNGFAKLSHVLVYDQEE